MPPIIIALVVVVGGLWFIRKMGRTPPQQMPGFLKKAGGVAIIIFASLLAMTGRLQQAGALLLAGLGLLGYGQAFPNGFSWGSKRSEGQKSRVATSQLAMELDHDTGSMDGEILAGPFKGKRVSDLAQAELLALHKQCAAVHDQSLALLEAWLDRCHGDWRSAWGVGGSRASGGHGAMSRDEALAVLGLKAGASPDDIKAAHKRLMKDFHPDKGGSDYLASKINAAKDLLLG